ncbi:MAG: UDP-galactopyranose mutase [Flavobacteriia bacterium]|nr:UDP-galactopyranose mutase [Flavobacteriia bacterium]
MTKPYDFLIVGAGIFGSVSAYELKKKGYRCLVIEKREHIGGNCYTKSVEGINVHQYGAHIFHTNDKEIWEYVNGFAEFNRYTNSPIANYKDEIYNLPFNMNTFHQLWGVKTPEEAKAIIDEQVEKHGVKNPENLEEQAISLVGIDIYNKLIREYTEKQWGTDAKNLPAFIIKRLPVRFTYDNNYFNDRYQGIPIGGYTQIFEKLLEGTEVRLNTDYLKNRNEFDELAEKVIYTGPIDAFYDYCFGALEYRSLRFDTEVLDMENYQGNAVVNYTSHDQPYTRIIEHKHFEFGNQPKTVITREYPSDWDVTKEPYYPVNNSKNDSIFKKYRDLNKENEKYIFGGRLAEYRYYDMHQVFGSALNKMKRITDKNQSDQ